MEVWGGPECFLRCMEHVEGVWRGRGRSGARETRFSFFWPLRCTSKRVTVHFEAHVSLLPPSLARAQPSPWSRGRRRGSTTSSACQPTGGRRQVSSTRTSRRPSASCAPPATRAASRRSTSPASAGRRSRTSRLTCSGTLAALTQRGKQLKKYFTSGLGSSLFLLHPSLATREVKGGSRVAAA